MRDDVFGGLVIARGFWIVLALCVGCLWAKGFEAGWADEVDRRQGVVVFYTTYREILGKEKEALIAALKIHPQSVIRLAARRYYGGGFEAKNQDGKDHIELQFLEPHQTTWSTAFLTPIVSAYIEKSKAKILNQLYSRMP